MKIFYRLQYNNGQLSCVIKDNKEQIKLFADVLAKNKQHYPVAIIKVIVKTEA